MRRITLGSLAIILLLAAAAGCARQEATTADTAMSDSLLSSNPIEPPAGDITPQGELEQPVTEPQQPAATTPAAKPRTQTPAKAPSAPAKSSGYTVPAGTALNISVNTQITTETATVGDTWSGEITENIVVGDRVAFPKGSIVSGRITEVIPAEKGKLAKLGMSVTSITANGTTHNVDAAMEPIEAGSTRARNIGAVAGGAAAGALVGKAVGGGGKGALVGGLIGAAATGAAVAKSKGYQVVLKEGTVVDFKVTSDAKIRS